MQTLLEIVLPAVVVFTTLFGLLSRGDPRPGGVALFWRVGLVGLALGGVLWYLTFRTSALVSLPAFVSRMYYGLILGGGALTLFAAAGTALKKKSAERARRAARHAGGRGRTSRARARASHGKQPPR